MTPTSVLICAPIRYRPECPEVLGEFLEALGKLEWPGSVEFYFVVHSGGDQADLLAEDAIRMAWLAEPEDYGPAYEVVEIPSRQDDRHGGPRRTKETQLNLAYLRSRLFHHWEHETKADLCLMVDSDVVLDPGALRRMWDAMGPPEMSPRTVSLQINNTPFEGGEPAGNAMVEAVGRKERGEPYYDGRRNSVGGPNCGELVSSFQRASWGTEGDVIEVARAGACTLYPRSVCRYRFTFDPTRHEDEQDGIFDRMREDGFRHYLIRDLKLADHRMKRLDSGHREYLKANATDTSPGGIFIEED